MGTLALAILALAAAQQPSPAIAAPGSRVFYIQAAPIVTRDAAGTPNHRIQPPLSGYAVGFTATGGYAYSPSAAVEVELAWAGVVSTPQTFSYNWREEYRTQNSDRFMNVLGRWFAKEAYVSVVGGGGFTWTTVSRRDGVRTDAFFTNRPPTAMSDQSEGYMALTLTGGLDAEIPLSPRVLLVPTGRVRWVNWPDDGPSAYAGSGAYVFQFGIGLRAAF